MNRFILLRVLVSVAFVPTIVGPALAIEFYSQAGYEFPSGGSTSKLPVPISADDFTPNADWSVTRVTFGGGWRDTGTPLPPGGGSTPIRLAFHADSAGLPAAAPLHLFNIMADASQRPAEPGSLLYYDFDLQLPSPVVFDAAVRYWVSVADGRPSPPSGSSMFWEFSPDGNNQMSQTDGFGEWQPFTFDDLAFALHGVPEPSTFALLMGALAIVVSARRKTQR